MAPPVWTLVLLVGAAWGQDHIPVPVRGLFFPAIITQCDFEDNSKPFCDWTQVSTDDGDWTRTSGPSPTGSTRPPGGYPNGEGYFLYMDSSTFPRGGVTRLRSPRIWEQGPLCVHFAYHMFGLSWGAQLKLLLFRGTKDKHPHLLWKHLNTQSLSWMPTAVTVPIGHALPSRLVFEGVRGSTAYLDISLDAISVHRGSCNQVCIMHTCSFDTPNDLCGWSWIPTASGAKWVQKNGSSGVLNVGPEDDFSSPGSDNHLLSQSAPHKAHFQQSLSARHAKLHNPLLSLSRSPPSPGRRALIKRARVRLRNLHAHRRAVRSRLNSPHSHPPPRLPVASPSEVQVDWLPRLVAKIGSGDASPSVSDQPSFTGGFYMLLDSKNAKPTQKSILLSPLSQSSGCLSLSFHYTLHGQSPGAALIVYASVLGSIRKHTLFSGQSGPNWQPVSVNYTGQGQIQFTVVGVFGKIPEPAVAVDAISIAPCGESFPQCDFEDDAHPFCDWAQTSGDGGYWTRGSKNMPIQHTDPFGMLFNREGGFIYLEANNFSRAGQSFRLVSRPFCAPGAVCVEFAYYMYGLEEGTKLRLLLGSPAGSSPTSLWQRIGSQSPDWLNVSITIPSGHQQPMQLILEAIRGTNTAFVVAVGFILINHGTCREPVPTVLPSKSAGPSETPLSTEKPMATTGKPVAPTEKPTVSNEISTIPTEKPTVPTEKPTVPTEKPIFFTENLTISTEKLTVPTEKPTVSTEKPTVPSEEPTVPTEKHTVYTERTTVPTEKPIISTEKSTIPTEKPTVPTEKPTVLPEEPTIPSEKHTVHTERTTVSTGKPIISTEKSTILTENPTIPTEKPTVSTEKPIVSTEKPTVPTEKPTVPTEKPTVPTEKLTIPTEKPTIPTEKPTIPTEKPTVPTEKPTVPTEKPTVPTEKPTIPTEKLTIPTEKPTISTEKPTIPTEKSTIPTEKRTVHTEKPTIPTEKPTVPTEKSTISTEKPTIPTEKPAVHIERTTVPMEKPTIPTEKPTIPTEKPTVPTEKPTIPTEKPTVPTEKKVYPTIPTEKPTIPTEKPTIPTEKPTIPTEKPTIPTEKPTIPTEKPTIPTVKPTVPTEKSTIPTEKPTVPIEKSTIPTEKPTIPTEKPTIPTEKPAIHIKRTTIPTEKPTVPTEKPTIPTKKPTVPTEKPTIPAEKPTVRTEKPTIPTEKPTVPTEKPTISTKKFTIPTEKPTIPTEKPTILTEKTMVPTEKPTFSTEKLTVPTERPTAPATPQPSPTLVPKGPTVLVMPPTIPQTSMTTVTLATTATPRPIPASCPANAHYEPCACPASCQSPKPNCGLLCKPGCVCNSGFLFNDSHCINASSCNCFDNNNSYKPGAEWFSPNCTELCRCWPGSRIECQISQCGTHTVCQLKNGQYRCHPYDTATCFVYGDPHYLTFDGRHFNFMGKCTYILAQPCGNSTVPFFRVMVKNEKRGQEGTSCLNKVYVRLPETNITLLRGRRTLVGSQQVTLPAIPSKGIFLTPSGRFVELQTAFGLRLRWDGDQQLFMSVPRTYSGKLCGLCGNYDGDSSNDNQKPDGRPAGDAEELGNSWQTVEDKDEE
ncbi:Zonadhesin [Pteropus alecto]|uniref:Zonadhesin n=1 Tax=Pteropus alecto TaxID=9402 RepID=L5K845_PTEAL|nr:Zonadhesin [Pteropus alecto]